MRKKLSIIIPARNEEALIAFTLNSILKAVSTLFQKEMKDLRLEQTDVEIIVVNNMSTEHTQAKTMPFVKRYGVQIIDCKNVSAACARNHGAMIACGEIFCFIDSDTLIPRDGLDRIIKHCEEGGFYGGIFRLTSLEGGFKAWCWWTFWEHIRRLPLV